VVIQSVPLFEFVLCTHTVTLEHVSPVINQITSVIRRIPCDEGQTSTEVGTRFEVIAPYRRIVATHAGHRVLSLRQHRLRSTPLVHFETTMERSSQRGTRATGRSYGGGLCGSDRAGNCCTTLGDSRNSLYHSTERPFLRIVGSHFDTSQGHIPRRHANFGRQRPSMMATNISDSQAI